jgi:hypothetical protein
MKCPDATPFGATASEQKTCPRDKRVHSGRYCKACQEREVAAAPAKPKPPPCLTCAEKRAQTIATMKAMAGLPLTPAPEVSTIPRMETNPRLAIVIPARNENYPLKVGDRIVAQDALLLTIASIAETSKGFEDRCRIYVIDEASDKPVDVKLCAAAAAPIRLRVIRNFKPLGVHRAQNQGINLAFAEGAEVAGHIDAHMTCAKADGTPIMGGYQKLARECIERKAIIVGRCGALNEENNGQALCGGDFCKIIDALRTPEAGLPYDPLRMAFFNGKDDSRSAGPDATNRVNGTLGGNVFYRREDWERLGGYLECAREWGYCEEAMGLKAAFLDIPIYCVGSVMIRHWFRRKGPAPYVVNWYQKFANRVRAVAVTFSEEMIRNFWIPRFKAAAHPTHAPWDTGGAEGHVGFEAECFTPEVTRERNTFRAKIVKTDAQVLKELFGVDAVAGLPASLTITKPSMADAEPVKLVRYVRSDLPALGEGTGMALILGAICDAIKDDPRFALANGDLKPGELPWHMVGGQGLMKHIALGKRVAIGTQVTPIYTPRMPWDDNEKRVLGYENYQAIFTLSRRTTHLLQNRMAQKFAHYVLDLPLPESWILQTNGIVFHPSIPALIYAKSAPKDIVAALQKAIPDSVVVGYKEYKEPLWKLAQKSKVCFYLAEHENFSFAALEIALAGCPIIADEKSLPVMLHGLTGLTAAVREWTDLESFQWAPDAAERLMAEYKPALMMDRSRVRRAIIARYDRKRAVGRIAAALGLSQ